MIGYDKYSQLHFRLTIDGIDSILFVKKVEFEQKEPLDIGGPNYCGGKVSLSFYEKEDLEQFDDWFTSCANNVMRGFITIKRNLVRNVNIKYFNNRRECVRVINLHTVLPSCLDLAHYKVTLVYDYNYIQTNP